NEDFNDYKEDNITIHTRAIRGIDNPSRESFIVNHNRPNKGGNRACPNVNDDKIKVCMAFYGPWPEADARDTAQSVGGGTPMKHGPHAAGQYPHYHLAGHKCIEKDIDCTGRGQKSRIWVNPHFRFENPTTKPTTKSTTKPTTKPTAKPTTKPTKKPT